MFGSFYVAVCVEVVCGFEVGVGGEECSWTEFEDWVG